MESNFERSMLCVWGEICSNNACDLKCVCSFRMSFLFVFVCLYISNCSRVSSFRPFVCTCRMFTLLSMFYVKNTQHTSVYTVPVIQNFSSVVQISPFLSDYVENPTAVSFLFQIFC